MILDRPTCYNCPDCSAPHLRSTIASGNTFRSWLFSDGKMEAPMLPDVPFITKCYQCGLIFYLDSSTKSQLKGEVEETAPYASFLDRKGYSQVIRDGFYLTESDEYRVRLRYLWSFNDPFRRTDGVPDWSVDIGFTGNIDRLLEMIDFNDPENLLFAAELNRLAGKFDQSDELLIQYEQEVSSVEPEEIVHDIRIRNLAKDSRIFTIRKGEN